MMPLQDDNEMAIAPKNNVNSESTISDQDSKWLWSESPPTVIPKISKTSRDAFVRCENRGQKWSFADGLQQHKRGRQD